MSSEDGREAPGISLPAAVERFARVLIDAGHAAYLVGGAVRNLLQDRPTDDWDIATDATPGRVQGLYPRTIPTGIRHGTVTVLLGRRRSRSRPSARSPATPTGGGPMRSASPARSRKIWRGATSPSTRSPSTSLPASCTIRMAGATTWQRGASVPSAAPANALRRTDCVRSAGCRLAAELNLTVDGQTVRAMRDALPTARRVAVERVCEELRRLLLAPTPSVGLGLLERSGLMELCLPAASATAAGPAGRGARYARIDAAPTDAPQRLAMLLAPEDAADVPAATARAQAALTRLRFPHAVTRRVVTAIGSLSIPLTADSSDAAIRRLLAAVGRAAAADAIAVRRAIARIDAPLARRVHRQAAAAQALTIGELAVDGGVLQRELGLRSGPNIGRLLRALLRAVLADPAVNDRARLLDVARALQDEAADPPAPDSSEEASAATSCA